MSVLQSPQMSAKRENRLHGMISEEFNALGIVCGRDARGPSKSLGPLKRFQQLVVDSAEAAVRHDRNDVAFL